MTGSLTGSSGVNLQNGEGTESKSSTPRIKIFLERSHRPFISRLLQEGFFLHTKPGISIKDFLSEHLKLEEDYVSGRISTVFLNGVPVDDLASETLADGSVLALSAAMPGLAGAILRKGGYLAGLRTKVATKDTASPGAASAWVKVKLFNALVSELGPGVLSRGIWIKASSLKALRLEGIQFRELDEGTMTGESSSGSLSANPDEMIHLVVTA